MCIITSCYNRECKAVITMFIPLTIIVMFERGDIITHNSPVKLVVEGGAKSIRLARNLML